MTHTYKVTFTSTIEVEFDEEPDQDEVEYKAWQRFDMDYVSIHSIEEL